MAWQQQPNYGNQGFPGAGGPFPGAGYPGGGYPGGYPAGGYPAGGYPGGYPQQPPQAGFYPGQPGVGFPGMGFHMPPDVESQGQGFPKNSGDSDFQGFEFSDKTIRTGFIRKVYSILMLQLLVTFGFVALFVFNDDMKLWSRRNPAFMIGALVLTFVLLIAMACCESVRRKSPMNFICLGLFTVSEGFLLGATASNYDEKSVLLAVGITTVICLALTVFSFQTKFDMTAKGGILFIFMIVLFLFGFLAMFLQSMFPIIKIVYGCMGALLFSAYLVYDTQLMMGGKHKYSISPEEYIFAALNLYLDIINIFIYILSIVGSRGD